MLDENFQTLQELGREIRSSVSEEQKNKIDLLLGELRTSLQIVKAGISGESVDGNEHVGESKDTDGFDKDLSRAVETGDGRVIATLRLSDDSDVDNEEHRVLGGSSDGSQYGSDSGMGDSLMNTLASECTDGPSKTPTVSPVHKEASSEARESGDAVCEDSPVKESRVAEQFAQAKPVKYSEGRQNSTTQGLQNIDLIGQKEGANNIEEISPNDLTRIPARKEQSIAGTTQLHDDVMNTIGDDDNMVEGTFILNNITQNVPPAGDERNTVVPRAGSPTTGNYGNLMKVNEDSDDGSLEYLDLPKITPGNDSQTQNGIELDNFGGKVVQLENTGHKDQSSSDSRLLISVEFLQPEPTSGDETREASSFSGFESSNETPYEMEFPKHSVYDIASSERTSSEDSLSVQTSSEDLSREKSPQKTRLYEIDEELLVRNRALQDVQPEEKLREGEDLETEYPLVSCTPPPMKTVEEFVTEPDELFQRLVDIEVMLRPQENNEENLKSALLKHVVSTSYYDFVSLHLT